MKNHGSVVFPQTKGIIINMMPFVVGDPSSLPKELHPYLEIIDQCKQAQGETAYLTIHESFVEKGVTQRRPGLHTDATSKGPWGGGEWGGRGIFLASTDGACRIFLGETHDVDSHGAEYSVLSFRSQRTIPNTLYQISDRTPHESLPATKSGARQFFRLVTDPIFGWWREHSTENPTGVRPNAPIIEGSKFRGVHA